MIFLFKGYIWGYFEILWFIVLASYSQMQMELISIQLYGYTYYT